MLFIWNTELFDKWRWKIYIYTCCWYDGVSQWFFGGSLIYSMNKFIFSWLFIRFVFEQRNELKGNLKYFVKKKKLVGINEYNCICGSYNGDVDERKIKGCCSVHIQSVCVILKTIDVFTKNIFPNGITFAEFERKNRIKIT